ncbi:hypothetical protein B0A48_15429 [Cryoendolithus antarcticus]|uniref:Thioesterase domain-containing protein n=1 Tax=Cryoendolithus antarcticus TaxID=1507870 RepID=A0A1V8SI46_9PEZI|nr:hypothetical protein B0A48_15429 [Cryoendolithus antarcticus]
MSASNRLPVVASTLTFGAFVAAISTFPSLRHRLSSTFGITLTPTMLRIFALAFALVNLKNLPFVWHWRVFKGIIYQSRIQKAVRTPETLFAPLITHTYSSPLDLDYNLHKSNSTYFADLDVARAHYVGSIIATGLRRLNAGDREGLPEEVQGASRARGGYGVALGGVGCWFHKEIGPMVRFEIWTRLLSWDRKWLYIISHVVRAGTIKPESYAMQPWKNKKLEGKKGKGEGDEWKKQVFATSIARYVLKKGRLTINPEIVLERSRLLPARPEGIAMPPRAEAEWASKGGQSNGALKEPVNGDGSEPEQAEGWTWDKMEEERLRGLRIAVHFDALGSLQDEMRTDEALGSYSDWL